LNTQFAPQVGDVDNNLNRADAVLSKANPQNLDLLVLPELAFSGELHFVLSRRSENPLRLQQPFRDIISLSYLQNTSLCLLKE
jgi:predicted amidohydrolase